MRLIITFISIFLISLTKAQSSFDYFLELEPVSINNLPGIHSYAFGQYSGNVLLVGGRVDGMHPRQPFNSFPESKNNTMLYVVDMESKQVYSTDLTSLSSDLQEQLQSTNMQFYQDQNTLFVIGGYGYSASSSDHITYPFLTSIAVPQLIEAIAGNQPIAPYFKQLEDQRFAVTGGQLGKIDQTFYLVGGQRFDGRYNPMNMSTFTQTYTDKIQKFSISTAGSQLSINNYIAINDPVHLHRRDYNLLPQIYPDGTEGYMISSGVFQLNVDLPFLYPVDITDSGHTPQTGFNQYLSNYHSAHTAMFDSLRNEMHMIFFGGMSQYYFNNGTLIQDDGVPFVKTISLVTRASNGSLEEFALPIEMPSLEGASAEFIPNEDLPYTTSGILKLQELASDTTIVGHILGGISSNSLNPFNVNNTNDTEASNTLYAVKLIKSETTTGIRTNIENSNFNFNVAPNPVHKEIHLSFELEKPVSVDYFIVDMQGKMLASKELFVRKGLNEIDIPVDKNWETEYLIINLSFADKHYVIKKVLLK